MGVARWLFGPGNSGRRRVSATHAVVEGGSASYCGRVVPPGADRTPGDVTCPNCLKAARRLVQPPPKTTRLGEAAQPRAIK